MRWIRVVFLLMLAAVASTAAVERAGAASYAQETLDRYFRVEFDVSRASPRATIGGYVYNQHPGYTADRMRLSIERLDASGQVIGTSSTWLLGGVPPGNRAYFSARVEPAAAYRVQVESFEWTGRGGGSN
jgi:hypothetical protein